MATDDYLDAWNAYLREKGRPVPSDGVRPDPFDSGSRGLLQMLPSTPPPTKARIDITEDQVRDQLIVRVSHGATHKEARFGGETMRSQGAFEQAVRKAFPDEEIAKQVVMMLRGPTSGQAIRAMDVTINTAQAQRAIKAMADALKATSMSMGSLRKAEGLRIAKQERMRAMDSAPDPGVREALRALYELEEACAPGETAVIEVDSREDKPLFRVRIVPTEDG